MRPSLFPAMNATGIGYAGIDGVWWRPAAQPFQFSATLHADLARSGAALFGFVDAVWQSLRAGDDPMLASLLRHKVPPALMSFCDLAPVLSFRPDFQLQPWGNGVRPVLTEIESAPSAHGFAHAMQIGYGRPADLVDAFVDLLAGRTLYFAGTAQWSEFMWEQLAFCRAIRERGGKAFVLYDRTLAQLRAEIARGERWQPPLFGVPVRPPTWDTDLDARLDRHGLRVFWRDEWPAAVGDGVIFRFGYLENFSADTLARLWHWATAGAPFLNPLAFPLDSKVLLCALQMPSVRARLDSATLQTLDAVIPETHLLTSDQIARFAAERTDWLIKYAGFDGGNAAWGGRSVEIGREQTPAQWHERLHQAAALPWPVVAQRMVESVRTGCRLCDKRRRSCHTQGWLDPTARFLCTQWHTDPCSRGAHHRERRFAARLRRGGRGTRACADELIG